ncbi:hypothetical protein M5E88_10580 [Akkermansia muciniphila]|nr:hypothetical protein M5E88_10580 [Akkermansia muciniphila]
MNNIQAGKDNVVVPDISGNRAYGKQGFMRGPAAASATGQEREFSER